MTRLPVRCAIPALLILSLGGIAIGRPVSGKLVVKLTAPVTKEFSDQAALMVRDSFMVDLTSWIGEMTDRTPDVRNPVVRFHLSALVDSCLKSAKRDSRLDGRTMNYSLLLSADEAESVLRQYNDERAQVASQLRARAQEAAQSESYLGAYIALMSALFHEAGRFVSSNAISTETSSAARKLLQRISITSDEMVVTGKPGTKPRNSNSVKVTIDSVPVSGIALRAGLADGRILLKGITNVQGEFSLSDISIPFVPKGTFLNIGPDLGATIGVPVTFGPRHLGVGLPDLEHVLIYNIIPATYTLKYSVSASEGIDISQHEFSNSRHIEKFLADSCFMQPRSGTDLSDLIIEIDCRILKVSPEDRDDDVMKTEAKIVFQPLQRDGRVERQATIHEITTNRGSSPSVGLFLWESANRLKRTVKTLLTEL